MSDALQGILEGREGIGDYEGRGRKTPIDSVWLDAFKDEGKEEKEEEGKEEEEGKRKEEEDNI